MQYDSVKNSSSKASKTIHELQVYQQAELSATGQVVRESILVIFYVISC